MPEAISAARALVVLALTCAVLGVLGTAGGTVLGSAGGGTTLRAVLVLTGAVVATRALARAVADDARALRAVAAGSCAALLVVPWFWEGRAVGAQLAVGPGPLAAIGDGALWCAAVLLGAAWGRATANPRDRGRPLTAGSYR